MLLRFDDFSSGLWIPGEAGSANEQAGFAIPDAGLLTADNIDFLPDGSVRGRRGSLKANAAAVRPGEIRALARFYGRAFGDETATGIGLVYSDPAGVGAPWTNPGGAAVLVSDSAWASVGLVGGSDSEYLTRLAPFLYNPLPSNATVTGIRARVWVRKSPVASFFQDAAGADGGCRVIQGGAFVGTAQTTTTGTPFPDNYPFFTILDYGGPGNTWGLAGAQLTPAALNALDFGIGFRCTLNSAPANVLQVDYIEITVYFSAASTTRFLVCHAAGGNLIWETLSGGAFTGITGGTYSDPGTARRPWMVGWPQKSKLFLFDGINPAKVYDGAEIADVATRTVDNGGAGIAPKKGPYAVLHRNRLWVTDPGELQFSVYACDINDETNWRPNLQLAVNDQRGGKITGLASYFDSLIILKDTALFSFNGDPEFGGQLLEYSPDGCVAPDTIQATPYGILYLGRDGLRLTDGNGSTLLSQQIRPLFRSRTTDQTRTMAVGVYFPRRDQYWLKLDPLDVDGYILHRITFPTDSGEGQKTAWSHVPALPMNCGAVWPGSEDLGELYLGDVDGLVWQRDVGETDDGSAIGSVVRTQQRILDPRTRALGRVYQLRPMFRGSAALDFSLRYDQSLSDNITLPAVGATTATPEYQEPRRFVADFSQFGRFVSLSVESNAGPQFELGRVDCDIRMRGTRLWR